MPPKKGKAPQELAPVISFEGYRRAPRYEEIEYRPDELADGEVGLKFTIRVNLSFAEAEAIPYGLQMKFADIFPAIADYVAAWNVMGENLETGEWEPVPPPAEGGVSSFDALSNAEALWLILAIKYNHRQKLESEKGKTGSAPSELGPVASDEPS